MTTTRPLADRFWSHVDKSADCWEWTASTTRAGYGQINVGDHRIGLAHRVAYELAVGPIPDGLVIDHRCRNRICVRPDHLRVVSVKQNAENRAVEGVGRSGARGVKWDRHKGRWVAGLTHNGRTIHVGYFDDVQSAAAAARAARLAHFTHSDTDLVAVAS